MAYTIQVYRLCYRSVGVRGTRRNARSCGRLPGSVDRRGNARFHVSMSELVKEDVVVGDGAEAKSGKMVSVHYTGTLTSGKKFDSSHDRGSPFDFPLGAGRVIRGWDEGVVGMKVGGKRKLTIPSELAYGSDGFPGLIPPNSTLIFEVELIAVR